MIGCVHFTLLHQRSEGCTVRTICLSPLPLEAELIMDLNISPFIIDGSLWIFNGLKNQSKLMFLALGHESKIIGIYKVISGRGGCLYS